VLIELRAGDNRDHPIPPRMIARLEWFFVHPIPCHGSMLNRSA